MYVYWDTCVCVCVCVCTQEREREREREREKERKSLFNLSVSFCTYPNLLLSTDVSVTLSLSFQIYLSIYLSIYLHLCRTHRQILFLEIFPKNIDWVTLLFLIDKPGLPWKSACKIRYASLWCVSFPVTHYFTLRVFKQVGTEFLKI